MCQSKVTVLFKVPANSTKMDSIEEIYKIKI